ncbi:GAP family protein [[Clostridium] dakarense]|uniref:GAP family protein n=1 Tax=Faecalimicrobium dakarense TaxID=1301100 RepID=UPI0004B9FB48|nr:GAP family protein [[Clostridium] dakarense]
MLSLLLLTVTTSAADSLNPVGIAQQFILQGLVKKKHHIWAYIISIAITNFTGGLIVYFGAGAFIKKYMNSLLDKYSNIIYISEFILGLLVLMSVVFLIMKIYVNKLKDEILILKGLSSDDNNNSFFKIKSVDPISLSIFGVLATFMELTTALPYFAFLAILLTYTLPIWVVISILIIYNIIYSAPLIILYFLYVKCQSKFDELYVFLKNKVDKYAAILSPILIGAVGVLLIFHSLNSLITL